MINPVLHMFLLGGFVAMTSVVVADEFQLQLRTQKPSAEADSYERITSATKWDAAQTAVIVCDVWDKHHCLNAVRRMDEFLPRMNALLKFTRQQGATIIHAPSDCMPAYAEHPARLRAIAAPVATNKPTDVEFWCSSIPAEEQAVYPIDQSDGGEDDDPEEHARWAAELKALGRNPGMPWKMQSDKIEIDNAVDYISDRGDEVWSILESRGIRNVILVGVHTNMCVLGRPFGLRQMARNGKNVVLMRDLTDCMYNPKRWPYVDHFTGNDLIISHVERFVCPTISSDQILGGTAFVSKYDKREQRDVTHAPASATPSPDWKQHWTTGMTGTSWADFSDGQLQSIQETVWSRCSVRLPSSWLKDGSLRLEYSPDAESSQAWINGTALKAAANGEGLTIPVELIVPDDINLLVVRTEDKAPQKTLAAPSAIHSGNRSLVLKGRWQFRLGDSAAWSNIPLPAKFGMGSDVLFEAR
jgi:nicotinamidase-related amidase